MVTIPLKDYAEQSLYAVIASPAPDKYKKRPTSGEVGLLVSMRVPGSPLRRGDDGWFVAYKNNYIHANEKAPVLPR